MTRKCLAIATAAAIVLGLVGCGKEDDVQRLTEIAIKVQKQEKRIEEMAGRVQAIEASVRDIRDSLREIALGHGQSDRAEAQETPVRETEGTPAFDQVAAAISDIQHRLNLVEGSLEGAKPEAVTDPIAALREQLQVAEDHQEMGNRLDALLQEFAWQIDDPAKREEFQADIGKLRQTITGSDQNAVGASGFAAPYTDVGTGLATVRYEPLSNAVNTTTLQIAPNLTETQSTMIIFQAPDTRSRLADLVTKYDIPIDVLKDVGLASTETSQAKPDPQGTPSLLPKLTTVNRKTI